MQLIDVKIVSLSMTGRTTGQEGGKIAVENFYTTGAVEEQHRGPQFGSSHLQILTENC